MIKDKESANFVSGTPCTPTSAKYCWGNLKEYLSYTVASTDKMRNKWEFYPFLEQSGGNSLTT